MVLAPSVFYAGEQCQRGGRGGTNSNLSSWGGGWKWEEKEVGKREGVGEGRRGKGGRRALHTLGVGLWNTKNLKERCQDPDLMWSVAHHT